MDGNTVQSTGVSIPQKQPFFKRYLPIFIISSLILISIFALLNYYQQSSTPQKQQTLYQKEINQIDSLIKSIQEIKQPLNPKLTQEEFKIKKRDIEVPAQTAKVALENNNTEAALKSLNELKAAVGALGNPLNEAFIPKSVRDAVDPQGQVLKSTDAVDPAVRDMYLEVVKMQLAMLGGK